MSGEASEPRTPSRASILPRKVFGVPLSRWLLLAALLAVLVTLSVIIRERLDLDWSVASVRDFIARLGPWGPIAFISVLTFRFLFLIPTELLLIAAGVLFGALLGTWYASLGLLGSGILKIILVRIIGRTAILAQVPDRVRAFVEGAAQKRLSAWALFGGCAYPFLPKHFFQLAAILSNMDMRAYLGAVFVGGGVQAAVFATLGHAVISGAGVAASAIALLAALILPMAYPPTRRWLLAPFTRPTPKPTATGDGLA